jgi:hypothetical protein
MNTQPVLGLSRELDDQAGFLTVNHMTLQHVRYVLYYLFDVFCIDVPVTSVAGSRILIFYLSRISDFRTKKSRKTGGGKIYPLIFICSHIFYKFYKIVNYFIFGNVDS